MTYLLSDLRIAFRGLRRRPGFTALAVGTLGLASAATTVVLSLVYAVLLRPLPFPEPEGLARMETVRTDQGVTRGCSLLDIEDYQRMAATLDGIGAYTVGMTQLQGDGPALAVTTAWVTSGVLAVVGVEPVLGRRFTPAQDRTGGDVQRVLLSHGLWLSRFGGDPGVLGKTIHTPVAAYTVAGVMPPGFDFPEHADMWVPMESWYAAQTGDRAVKKRGQFWYSTIARLAPGVSLAEARQELEAVAAHLAEQFPEENGDVGLRLTSLRQLETAELRPYLALLVAGAAMLLAIGCANVAGLLLVHAAARERELAVRAALGAARGRLMGVVVAEAAILAAIAVPPSLALTYAGIGALRRLIPVPLPVGMAVEVDVAVLCGSLAIATGAALLAVAVPAWQTGRTDPRAVLAEGGRTAPGRARMRSALIVGEVALSLLLLIGAGLLVRTFLTLADTDPGFRRSGLLVVQVARYQAGETRTERAGPLARFHDSVLARLAALPGVEGTAATNSLPFERSTVERRQATLTVRGATPEDVEHLSALAGADVTPGYFAAMGIPILAGRGLAETDTAESPCVVLVDEEGARELWPDREPLGQELLWGNLSANNPFCTVIGVVGDVKHHAAEGADPVELYYSFRQWPVDNPYYVLRVTGDPLALAPAVRRAIAEIDPNTAVVSIESMTDRFDRSLWPRRLWGVAFAGFALLALALTAVGLYGAISYAVSLRTRELGIRVALGARSRDLLLLVIAEGLKLVGIGAALGLACAFVASRWFTSLLFGVRPLDPQTYVNVTLLLAVIALVACTVPARRAARIDPLEALRRE
ncbi:MAG: ABC transporter permease [Acidobacteriota bacterium]